MLRKLASRSSSAGPPVEQGARGIGHAGLRYQEFEVLDARLHDVGTRQDSFDPGSVRVTVRRGTRPAVGVGQQQRGLWQLGHKLLDLRRHRLHDQPERSDVQSRDPGRQPLLRGWPVQLEASCAGQVKPVL